MYMNEAASPACVKYISEKYMDSYCNDLIRRFDPSVITRLHPVNIEQLLEKFLGLKIGFENLSDDGSVLGATVFEDDERFPVYGKNRRRPHYIAVKEGTVLCDSSLKELGSNNRYRFTLAHEAGHAIWHGAYMRAQLSAGKKSSACLRCKSDAIRPVSDKRGKTNMPLSSIVEEQASKSALFLLMPKEAVMKLISPMGLCLSRSDALDRIILTAATFRVSEAAARERLLGLGLIKPGVFAGAKRKSLAV